MDWQQTSISGEAATSRQTLLQGVGQSIWQVHSIVFQRMQLSLWRGTMQQSMEGPCMWRILNLSPTVLLTLDYIGMFHPDLWSV